MVQNEYSVMQEHLLSLDGDTEKTRWVADFNAIAVEIEEGIQADPVWNDDQVSLPPWEARVESNSIYLYTPPLVYKPKGKRAFMAMRLKLNALKPVSGDHVNCKAVPVGDDFKITDREHFSCIIINTNAEDIETAPLVAVWFLWDSIARVGITRGLKTGLITEGWVNNVFRNAGKCGGEYPHAYYQRNGKQNEYLQVLYRTCEARGITQDMLHGEGRIEFTSKPGRDPRGTYYNTWIDEDGYCKCCNNKSPLKYGWGRYMYGSILSHVKSIRHRRNAAEYLLKMQVQENIQPDLSSNGTGSESA